MEHQQFSLSQDELKGLQRDPARRLVEPLQLARRKDPDLPRYLREYEKPLRLTQIPTESGSEEIMARLVLSIQDVGMFNTEKLERIHLGIRLGEQPSAIAITDLFHLRQDQRFGQLFEATGVAIEQNGDIPKRVLKEGGYEKLAGVLKELEDQSYWDELIVKASAETSAWFQRKKRS